MIRNTPHFLPLWLYFSTIQKPVVSCYFSPYCDYYNLLFGPHRHMGITPSARRRSTMQQRVSLRSDGVTVINENLEDDESESESGDSGNLVSLKSANKKKWCCCRPLCFSFLKHMVLTLFIILLSDSYVKYCRFMDVHFFTFWIVIVAMNLITL